MPSPLLLLGYKIIKKLRHEMLITFFSAREELFSFISLEKVTSVPGNSHRAQEATGTSQAARSLESSALQLLLPLLLKLRLPAKGNKTHSQHPGSTKKSSTFPRQGPISSLLKGDCLGGRGCDPEDHTYCWVRLSEVKLLLLAMAGEPSRVSLHLYPFIHLSQVSLASKIQLIL